MKIIKFFLLSIFILLISSCNNLIGKDDVINKFDEINYDYTIFNMNVDEYDYTNNSYNKYVVNYNEDEGNLYLSKSIYINNELINVKELTILCVKPDSELDSYFYVFKRSFNPKTNDESLSRLKYMTLECSYSFVLTNNEDFIGYDSFDFLITNSDLKDSNNNYYEYEGYLENNYDVFKYDFINNNEEISALFKVNNNRIMFSNYEKLNNNIKIYEYSISFNYDSVEVKKPNNVEKYEWVNSGYAPEII